MVMAGAPNSIVPADQSILLVAIVLIVIVTLIYTWLGGMTAVIWTDVLQMAIYVSGGIIAVVLLLKQTASSTHS